MSTEKLLEKIVEQLDRISDDLSILQQDVNAIRNGEYDEPQGAGTGRPSPRPAAPAVPDEEKQLGSKVW